ncbi:MAG: putative molybdenum carrier protein [Pseudomonadota bacterium]
MSSGMSPTSAMLGALVARLVSGGQTGVDRAALDFAIAHGIPHGGWCPAGRKASDGPLEVRYLLQETESEGWSQRTGFNVRDSDATLILIRGPLVGGSLLTQKFAWRLHRPVRVLDLPDDSALIPADSDLDEVLTWLRETNVKVLNVAGPGEERVPGVYRQALLVLARLHELGRGGW